MNFEEFKDSYFNGDSELALRALVNEEINNEYKLTGGDKNHKEILDSLNTNLANKYMEYFDEAIDIMSAEENVSKDIKDKLLSIKMIEHRLKNSAYSTKGMKYMLPISLFVIILFWILLGHKGTFEFLTTGVFAVPFIIIIICYAIISTKVTNSIKNLNYCIVEDQVIDKIYKPGNAEDAPECFFVFRNYGKYRLAFDEERLFNTTANGHSCYLIIPTNSKKIRFVFDSQIWKISERDFSFNNGIYVPYKNTKRGCSKMRTPHKAKLNA